MQLIAANQDPHGRRFRKLRLSLTAACNYACSYCVPNGKKLLPAKLELPADDLLTLTSLLKEAANLSELRITGGEPLLSPKFGEFMKAVPGLQFSDTALTTNGELLVQKLPLIVDSGIRRINVSLDTLDQNQHVEIARTGNLDNVLKGIARAQAAGIVVKMNMVPMRGCNTDQILPLLDYCLSRNIELRFIELMKMGHLQQGTRFEDEYFGLDDILELIRTQYNVVPASAPNDSTAVRFTIPGEGSFGVIANVSAPFCATCSRLRLASNGRLFGCLSNSNSHDLRPLLSMSRGSALKELKDLLRIAMKSKQTISFRGETTIMKFIGG